MATAGTSYNVAPNPQDSLSSILPIGSMMLWSTSDAPSGFLLCNGQAVSRTAFAPLFAVIGTLWGAGNGSTTFNVPNTANRVVRGVGNNYTQGSTGGAESVTLAATNLPNHSHTIFDPQHAHTYGDPGHFHQVEQMNTTNFGPSLAGQSGGTSNSTTTTQAKPTGITIFSASTNIITQDSVLVQNPGLPQVAGTQITQVPTTLVNSFIAINHIIKAF